MTPNVIRAALAIGWKELIELRRQPAVLALVVLGPFAVLAAFGLGYRNEELALRTIFVGPEDGPYAEAVDDYSAAISDYVTPLGYSPDLAAANDDLLNDRADLIIVLPPNPLDAVRSNQRSEIAVLHNSIDPIEQIGIDFATEVAVRELNATVVTASISGLSRSVRAFDEGASGLDPLTEELVDAIDNGDETLAVLRAIELRNQLESLQPSFSILSPDELLGNDGGTTKPDQASALDLAVGRLDQIARDPLGDSNDLDDLRASLLSVQEQLDLLLAVDAVTLARPFRGDAESLVRERVTAESHVAPGATALLIQHLAVSLAALSFVRDQRRGILVDLRMGPTSAFAIILGKLGSLSIVALAASLAIVAGQVFLLGVPFRGSIIDLIIMLSGLVVSSVALGLVLASVSRSELQASQAAMISLLLALFFSGFLLDLDRIVEPFRSLGLLAPATPAVDGLRSIQLRGVTPDGSSFLILGAQTLAGLASASFLITRKWSSS